jgi:ribosome maturation factor RimP
MPPATAGASAAQARERLLALLNPVVAGAGYDLEDVTVAAAGRRSLVRVIVDADGGIDLDAVAEVSKAVSMTIDNAAEVSEDGVLAGSYVLEVSSPGVDRPLTEPRHWRRAGGRLVSTTVDGAEVTGRITGVTDDGVTLDVRGAQQTVRWADLGRGRVQVEFGRAEGE